MKLSEIFKTILILYLVIQESLSVIIKFCWLLCYVWNILLNPCQNLFSSTHFHSLVPLPLSRTLPTLLSLILLNDLLWFPTSSVTFHPYFSGNLPIKSSFTSHNGSSSFSFFPTKDPKWWWKCLFAKNIVNFLSFCVFMHNR